MGTGRASFEEWAWTRGFASAMEAVGGHPKTTIADVAKVAGVAPIDVRHALYAHAARTRTVVPVLREVVARDTIAHYDKLKGFDDACRGLRAPWSDLIRGAKAFVEAAEIARDWSPKDGMDWILTEAFEVALSALTPDLRADVECGRTAQACGDAADEALLDVWDSVSIYDGRERFVTDCTRHSPAVIHLLATRWCRFEVENGGFGQLFGNSTGVVCPEAIEGFAAVGMPRLSQTVCKAMQMFGAQYAVDRDARGEAIKRLGLRFGDLDAEFYALVDRESSGYDPLADAYAKRHGFRGESRQDYSTWR